MVKQSVFPMREIFSSQRFGRPQVFAGILLLIFVAQCAWLVAHERSGAISTNEFDRIAEGSAQWHGRGLAGTPQALNASSGLVLERDGSFDRDHSPVWYLVESTPVTVLEISPDSALWIWFTRAPYIIFGILLGASLWYVSRRLYGNSGGYVALGLYCFSPVVIRNSTLWLSGADIGGAWGTFGAVFTAIAVSHTLYAPREVVLWNWRRTVLLGVSIALAAGSCFGLAVIIPVLLAFMLYLAHQRKRAAIVILAAACFVAFLLLFSSYFFHPRVFATGLTHARLIEASWRSAIMAGAYRQLVREVAASGPVLLLLVPASVVTYALWRRTRYFGNTAPLIVAILFLVLRVLSPHESGSVFSLTAVLFLLVFVAGIAADLLETKWRELFSAVFIGLIGANALWSLAGLAKIGR